MRLRDCVRPDGTGTSAQECPPLFDEFAHFPVFHDHVLHKQHLVLLLLMKDPLYIVVLILHAQVFLDPSADLLLRQHVQIQDRGLDEVASGMPFVLILIDSLHELLHMLRLLLLDPDLAYVLAFLVLLLLPLSQFLPLLSLLFHNLP